MREVLLFRRARCSIRESSLLYARGALLSRSQLKIDGQARHIKLIESKLKDLHGERDLQMVRASPKT